MILRRRALLLSAKLFDLAAAMSALAIAAFMASARLQSLSVGEFLAMRVRVRDVGFLIALPFLLHAVFVVFGLYRSRRLSTLARELADVVKATLAATAMVGLVCQLWSTEILVPGLLAAFWLITTATIVLHRLAGRAVLRRMRRHGRNLRHIVIVGTNERALEFARALDRKPEIGFHIRGFVDDEDRDDAMRPSGYSRIADFDGFARLLRDSVVDEVLMALPLRSMYDVSARLVDLCQQQGIVVRFPSEFFPLAHGCGKVEHVEEKSFITLDDGNLQSPALLIKRTIDIVVSATALVALFPLLLLVGVLIKLSSSGPVIFAQERIGLGKRHFRMYKFRTMFEGAEKQIAELEHLNEASGPVFKIADDPRVTRVGRILRQTSIDELPQFWNVLKGDMSLVGPRPLPLRDYRGFVDDRHRRRFSVRPGLTCLWQIEGRCSVSFERWMELDMEYIDRWSLWLDLSIFARTIPQVLRGSGAS